MQRENYFAALDFPYSKIINSISFSIKRLISYVLSRGLIYLLAFLNTMPVYCFPLGYAF